MSASEIAQQDAIIDRVYVPYIKEVRSAMTQEQKTTLDYHARQAQELVIQTPGNLFQDMGLLAFAHADPQFVREVIGKRQDKNRKKYDESTKKENKKAASNYECPPVAVDIDFANRLRNARTKKNFTQLQLAKLINVRVADLQSWEKLGGKRPNGVQRARLNRVLDTILPK